MSVSIVPIDAARSVAVNATHPHAPAIATALGRRICALDVTPDGLVAGYGDFENNTGVHAISALSLSSYTWTDVLPQTYTEQTWSFRHLADGRIVAPHVDPTFSSVGGNGYTERLTNGTWRDRVVYLPEIIHAYDFVEFGGKLWQAGSCFRPDVGPGVSSGVVWKSDDGGATWAQDSYGGFRCTSLSIANGALWAIFVGLWDYDLTWYLSQVDQATQNGILAAYPTARIPGIARRWARWTASDGWNEVNAFLPNDAVPGSNPSPITVSFQQPGAPQQTDSQSFQPGPGAPWLDGWLIGGWPLNPASKRLFHWDGTACNELEDRWEAWVVHNDAVIALATDGTLVRFEGPAERPDQIGSLDMGGLTPCSMAVLPDQRYAVGMHNGSVRIYSAAPRLTLTGRPGAGRVTLREDL